VDHVKGGVIPGVFMPAVEKGVRQALADGVTAGFPVEDLRVIVYDGKTHAVDGKEVAFVTAGRKATIEAIRAANPIVLEPIVSIEIVAPEAAIGDLTGDLSSRRGHITGTNPRPGNTASITGEVPLAEITDYASRLKSMTGGQGAYSIEFARHAQVPPQVQQKLAAAFRPQGRGGVSTSAGLRCGPGGRNLRAMNRRFARFLLLFAALWLPVQTMAGMSVSVCMNMESHGGMAAHQEQGVADAAAAMPCHEAMDEQHAAHPTTVATTARSAISPAPASCPAPLSNLPCRRSARALTRC
jgi:hypothetical protein